ncbi:hypothetical protein C1645_816362 [Glomus cerebriforme]|uniref:RRM domain-containing protein n=1 Tax=Glomus cerebriforme TaxID=658196 RepID=A0A397TLE4_9GLOM|nr:hypothetical protein C1645_816362 [Glomus cerebriforme]
MSLNEKSCRNCAVLKTQLEQQEAIVAKYLKIVQSQSELIQDLQNKSSTVGTSSKSSPRKQHPTTYNGWDTTSNDLNNKKTRGGYRAFIGSITSEIDKDSLKRCLEDSFGKVESIDIISSKACAFADFASPTAYHNAVSEGAVLVNGIALSVERVRRPKPRK